MRFVFLGVPDEPDVTETFAFEREWTIGVPQEVEAVDIAQRLARHPHWCIEGDSARYIGPAVVVTPPQDDAPEGDPAEEWAAEVNGTARPERRRPGRPRKVAA